MTTPKESQRSPEEIAQEIVAKHVAGLAMSIKDVAKYDTLVAHISDAICAQRARKSEPSKSFEEKYYELFPAEHPPCCEQGDAFQARNERLETHRMIWQAAIESCKDK